MSFYDYEYSKKISASDPPFYALIMAAMRKADTQNLDSLVLVFPAVYNELQKRYNAPGGMLPEDGPIDHVRIREEIHFPDLRKTRPNEIP